MTGPADTLAGLDEPVRRFLAHAVAAGAPPATAARLTMRGRIRAGAWLPFTAEQRIDRASFTWSARVGAGPLTLLRVTDRYADGAGSTEGRLLGRARIFGAADEHTTRPAAGRAALEAVAFAPMCLLPGAGVAWRAEDDETIVAAWDVPPERPEIRVRIDERGAPRTLSALRWGRDDGGHGYVPCGCEVHEQRRFGPFTVPGRVSVGWWFGTPRYAPFFRAELDGWAAVA